MEPERGLLTPGTSYGPPASDTAKNSAANTFVSHTLQASYSPTPRDELLPVCGEPWAEDADGSAFERIDSPLTREDSGRSAQRTFRPSAFPSSLAWDSDSEKETIDEEELQHFTNPHGLAAHSPGSPSSGLRLDSGEAQTPEKLEPLISEKEKTKPLEGEPTGSPLREEPKISSAQDLSLTGMADEQIWNASLKEEPFQSKVKPKEGHQIEKEEEKDEIEMGEKTQKGKDIKGPERDVYTFPGDSDPESPSPPAPWAHHSTFTQRRRKKRALLRPFSNVGTWQSSSPGALRRARGGPQRSKGVKLRGSRLVYDFEEDLEKECAEEEEEPVQEEKEEKKKGGEEEEGGGVAEEDMSKEIYTCVECSIYFKKQDHLQEHMAEHCQSGGSGAAGRRGRLAKGYRFRCLECGWNLPNRLALTDHRRRHQESRRRILEEIGKLSDGEKGDGEMRNEESSVPEAAVSALVVVPEPNQGPEPDSAAVLAFNPVPVPAPEPEQAPLPVPGRLRGRATGGNRRQFVCNKCDFATRTSQALANHAKTHNRPPKVGVQRSSPRLRQRRPPLEPSYPSTLTCDLCAFLASSQSMLREHRSLAHPERASVSGIGDEGVMGHPGTSSGNLYSIRSIPDPDELSGHESTAAPKAALESQHQPGTMVMDGSSQGLQFSVPHNRELAFKCIGNRRVNKRGQGWTGDASLCPRLDSNREEIENEYADRLRGNSNLATELNEEKTDSTAGFKPRTTTRLRLDCTSTHQSPTLLGDPGEKRVKEEEEEEHEEAAKLSPVKKNVSTVAKNSDSNENHYDEEEQIRHLLAKGILEEDEDEIDEETGTCVERKCPYCPDRFHNGIGLANHVRGHLNRVGVSYNVRHFISPEEVNAIEKKFSYQKKKKKVANFDPDTFSVMRCEFCSAGFDTRAGLSSHARAHLRDFGITNWEVTVSPIHILRELFSSRPDLVIPTAPPRSPGSQPEDEDEEGEEGEEGDVNDLDEEGDNLGTAGEPSGERKERETSAKFSNLMSSTSPQPWKTEHSVEELGGGEEDGEEDDDEAEQQRMPADLDSLSSSPGKKGLLNPDTESQCSRVEANTKGPNLLRCEVCGARFETRRGLSSHARSHLRQLGIGVSESSGAPIDLLYQISKERSLDSHLPSALSQSPSAKKPPHALPASHNDGPFEEDMDYEEKPVVPVSSLAKAVKVCSSASTPSPAASPPPSTLTGSSSSSPSPVVKKAPISSLLPVSSPLRSLDHKPGGIKSLSSSLSAAAAVSPSSAPSTTTTTTSSSMSKPFWAPQETDAPLNLTLEVDPNKDIICQLCGAWFETRKGLSSHARAHLRHFGVEYSESKGSPIDLLNQLIHTDDFKHRASALQPAGASDVRGLTPGLSSHKRSIFTTSSSSSPLLYKVTTVGGSGAVATSSSVSLLGPAPKRSKSSTMQVFRLSTGELMSMPHSEPTKEIGCEFCGEYFENRKGLSSHARSHLRQMGITEWSVNGSPIDTLREIITRRGLPCALPLRTLKTPPPSSPGPPRSPLSSSSSPSSASLLGRLPFAFARPSSPQTPVRKMGSGSRSSSTGLVLKLKPEPVQLEVTMPGTVGGSGTYNAESLNCSWSSSDNVFPLNLAMAQEVEPTRDIRCEFCGEYFENRKGLSSHARSHLRQMGITEWSVNGSPIDTLREIMHKRGTTSSSSSSPAQGVKKESSPTWEGLGGFGGLGSLASLGFQSPKFSRKSPLNLLHSGSRLHKHGLGAVGLSATPPPGKFFGVSALGKRPLSEDSCSLESTRSPPPQPKTFSPLPHDFSFKGKSSPDKHGGSHQDASCELCGFYFENRKALASHARAHLRQFGVTEWCVNGSPIETLSAWMRSRPHKVVEMHRSYMQGSHSTPKKKSSSPRSPPSDSDHAPSHRTPSSHWSALGLNQARPVGREVALGSPKVAEGESSSGPVAPYSSRPSHGGPAPSHARHGNHSTLPPHAQVARSELNVRLPRGFERRPLKHPSHPEGLERESGPAKPPRTGTIPALVPKPPSTPLVKLVGKFYTLKCRFCEVEFHGPLSVQEDWIRHLQQHILQLNYSKPSTATAIDSSAQPEKTDKHPEPAAASASTLSTTTPTAPSTTQRTPSPPPVKNAPVLQPSSSPPPTPPTGSDATVTATPTAPASTLPLVSPSPVPISVPSQAL